MNWLQNRIIDYLISLAFFQAIGYVESQTDPLDTPVQAKIDALLLQYELDQSGTTSGTYV